MAGFETNCSHLFGDVSSFDTLTAEWPASSVSVQDPRDHTILPLLRALSLLESLPESELIWLAERSATFPASRGRILFALDQAPECAYIIVEGAANLARITPDGRKLIVSTLGPGAILCEFLLFQDESHRTIAEAADDCLFLMLRAVTWHHLLARNPELALRIVDDLGRRLNSLHSHLEAMAFSSVTSRLARVLLRESDGTNHILGFTHQDLADLLGVYRETVSDALGKMRDANILSIGHKSVLIRDEERLALLADCESGNQSIGVRL